MQEHPFTARRLFNSRFETIKKELDAYYHISGNAACVIKLIRGLQIRQALKTEGIQNPCQELVRKIYFTQKRANREMKKYVYYFCAYFSQAEWQLLLLALFPELPVFHAWKIKVLLAEVCRLKGYRYTVP